MNIQKDKDKVKTKKYTDINGKVRILTIVDRAVKNSRIQILNEETGHLGPVLKVVGYANDGKQSWNKGKKVIKFIDDTGLTYNLWQTTDPKLISTIENNKKNIIVITGKIKKYATLDEETDKAIVVKKFIIYTYEVTDEIAD